MKTHSPESVNDVLERLFGDLRELDKAALVELRKARAEIRAGRYLTQDQVRLLLATPVELEFTFGLTR
jgi:hypothetical protein